MAKKPTDNTEIGPIQWDILLKYRNRHKITISLDAGKCLFIVGANGSGKSALIQQFVTELHHKKIPFDRYVAHRQPWFDNEATRAGKSAKDRLNENTTVMTLEADRSGRWSNPTAENGLKFENTFDGLIEMCYAFNRSITSLNDSEQITEERILKIESLENQNPLNKFNDLLKHGNIPITFSLDNPNSPSKLIARHNDNGLNVDIRELSDGERFIVLFAATAATMLPGTVLLIDEPDLHLHQSIIDPFFSALIASRKDCFFVFSTHNLSFPSAHPNSNVIIVHSCDWVGNAPSRFDVELLAPEAPVPEGVRQDILGARGNILFVEGNEESLDARLYRWLFPEFTVIPKGGYSQVVETVRGLCESRSLHHAEATGLVDKDMRSNRDIHNNLDKNVGVLKVWSVESIYYCIEAIGAVSRHQIEEGKIRKTLITTTPRILSSAYKVLTQKEVVSIIASHLAYCKIKKDAEDKIKKMDITKKELILGEAPSRITIDIADIYFEEWNSFVNAIKKAAGAGSRGWVALLVDYPLHKSDAFHAIAKALNLDKKSYADTLISLVQEDKKLAQQLREYINMPLVL